MINKKHGEKTWDSPSDHEIVPEMLGLTINTMQGVLSLLMAK